MMNPDVRQRFADIYRRNAWGCAETRSGPGSTIAETTLIVCGLRHLLTRLAPATILDAGCGEFAWQARLLNFPAEARWIGVEVVPEIVDANVARHPFDRWYCLDISSDPLPAAELILCRDVLVHLTLAEAEAALQNFRRTGARWLLATTFARHPANPELPSGCWRPLNLAVAPFDLGLPRQIIYEGCRVAGCEDKALGLWELNPV